MNHKILCIDDESHNLEALERLLRKKYSVVTASSGAEAIEKLKNHQFSLIISDQKMPEMTGVEFFMEAKKVQPEAIRILLTGYTDLESVIGAINQGQIYRYITKPWEPEEFLGVTRQAIEVHDMKSTIAKQNMALQQANKELMSLDKLKTEFMLLVNHELKTPLTGIFSFVQLLNEEKLEPEQTLYVNKILKNTKRLQDLINDTLLITRIQTDASSPKKVDLEIDSIILKQWQSLGNDFTKKKLQLNLQGPRPFLQNVNEKYIAIVIKKLLHNCFAHAKADTEVTITLNEDKTNWSINTKNQLTKKIDKDINQLLTAFSTSESILNHSGGSGLGLAVIQAILKLFSGSIEIQTEGKLFEIQINLPKLT